MIELAIFIYAIGYFAYFVNEIHALCDEGIDRPVVVELTMVLVIALICLIWPLFALEYICKKLIKG